MDTNIHIKKDFTVKVPSELLCKTMSYALVPLIKEKQAITYIKDTKLQEQEKQVKLTVIREYLAILRDTILKAAPDKTKFFLHKMKFPGIINSIVTLCLINAQNNKYTKKHANQNPDSSVF